MTPSTTWRRAAGPAAAATLVGIALILLIAQRSTAIGAAIFFAGCLGFVLLLIRDWLAEYTRRITDTTAERARLAAAEAEAHAAAAQSQAAHAATINLRERYAAHAADLEACKEQEVEDGIAAGLRDMEETRATELAEAYKQGVLDARAGRIQPLPRTPSADLIRLADWRSNPGPAAGGITRP